MSVAGYTAGYLGRHSCSGCNLGILYGFTTWSVALLLTAIVTSHVGNYVSSYSNHISHSVTIIPNNGHSSNKMVILETETKR